MKISNLATISNVGADHFNLATTLAKEESCLDAEGDEVLYIDATCEGIQRKLYEAQIINKKELFEIRSMECCTLLLTI